MHAMRLDQFISQTSAISSKQARIVIHHQRVMVNGLTIRDSAYPVTSQDLFRAKIQVRSNAHTEMLTYEFINATKNTVELVLNWEKKQFPVMIEFAVDDIVMANAAEELQGAKGFTWQAMSSAANYAMQNKVNHAAARRTSNIY